MPASADRKQPSYDEDVDFESLALQDQDFARLYHAAGDRVDFQDPKALQQLTLSLLKRDFGLRLELPDDRLCPPIPVRYNYIAWIQRLIDTTSPSYTDTYDPHHKVVGLDIGTGASSIYALLACASRPQWRMYATDIDSKSLSYARKNITLNELESRIRLQETTADGPLIPLDDNRWSSTDVTLDFTMCNPPFYSSPEDLNASYEDKAQPPSAVCTGAEVEMVCEGGDAGFVLRMVEESLRLKERVQWYSSMLGKLKSVHVVVARLRELGISNFAVACLRAGRKTRRWAVAWSFGDLRPRNDVARSGEVVQAILPWTTTQILPFNDLTRERCAEIVNSTIEALDVQWKWKVAIWTGLGRARENVWSRAARRKRQREAVDNDRAEDSSSTDVDEGVALAFKVTVEPAHVEVRWVQGRDNVLFESFCGMLKRTLREERS